MSSKQTAAAGAAKNGAMGVTVQKCFGLPKDNTRGIFAGLTTYDELRERMDRANRGERREMQRLAKKQGMTVDEYLMSLSRGSRSSRKAGE